MGVHYLIRIPWEVFSPCGLTFWGEIFRRQRCFRAASGAVKDKEPLKKAKTPQGRFDGPEEASQAALKKFPDDVNPETKERGGPRGPEPTRYGDWERKGRCVDF
ncbi:Succinate dehydrogenase assembly factor 4, mitochondrial [Liparis tanakae]|uniref:Succinate dehydrogenase assembly factor 4, mitochondrial n=1 Tax=Liparis tanakae TaxID=230148 RepID=A0A4Z2G7A2_9TELE|nr:Succinate dehydrogenase assembly factor 4, mitochondrial [Liparis tanakae]